MSLHQRASGLNLKNIKLKISLSSTLQHDKSSRICVNYLPLMIDKLLWTFTAQTVYYLGVVSSVATDELCQLCGTSAGFSGTH